MRIRINSYIEADKPKINIIDKGFDYSKTFSSYIFDKMRFGASTENDVEYEKSIYLGETFQMSPDVVNQKQIVKLDDTFDLNNTNKTMHNYAPMNSIKTITKKHPSITFASLFKQEEEEEEEKKHQQQQTSEQDVENNNNQRFFSFSRIAWTRLLSFILNSPVDFDFCLTYYLNLQRHWLTNLLIDLWIYLLKFSLLKLNKN